MNKASKLRTAIQIEELTLELRLADLEDAVDVGNLLGIKEVATKVVEKRRNIEELKNTLDREIANEQ